MPPVASKMGIPYSPKEGWVHSSLSRIVKIMPDSTFAVATTYSGKSLQKHDIDNITYYCLPDNGKPRTQPIPHLRNYWKEINEIFRPEVVHMHGTEYFHGYEWGEANGYDKIVVSIQGILSAYTRYYGGDMNPGLKYLTLRDFLMRESLNSQIKKWRKRGLFEEEFFKKIDFFIGRTEWDKSHVWALNPDAIYFYGGETLRESFYKNKWEYSNCNPHTIFLSQGSYPLKGADIVIKALPLVLKKYPDAKIRIAGADIMHRPWYRQWSYAKYLKKLSKALGVTDRISFIGMLDEEKVCDEYLKANIFICPSSIENSPNSLGEAQVLGVPHLASFSGGIPDITEFNKDVLYRFEEYEMLAMKICKIFELKDKYLPPRFDTTRYDGEKNTRLLAETYKSIKAINEKRNHIL